MPDFVSVLTNDKDGASPPWLFEKYPEIIGVDCERKHNPIKNWNTYSYTSRDGDLVVTVYEPLNEALELSC